MAVLSRKQIEAATDTQSVHIVVPEWGGEVILRPPSSLALEDYDRSLVRSQWNGEKMEVIENRGNAKARLVVKCLVDEDGKRLFGDEDAEALGNKSAAVVNRLFIEIQKLCGRGPAGEALARQSFPEGQSSGSILTLPQA